MRIYIDLFFLFNVIMDAIITISVAILLKRRTSIFRIVSSSILGGLSSLLIFTSLNKIVIEIFTILVMVFIAFGYKNMKYLLNNVFYMYLTSVLIGGIFYLFNLKVSDNVVISYLIMLIITIEVVTLYVKELKKMKNIYNNYYKVDIYFKDKEKIKLTGFVDTGNNLYDPYKKRPIILVSDKYYRDDDFVLVPYNTISDSGLLKCIKPDIIFIEGIGYKSNVLVAFSDKPILIDGVDVILHKDLMKG